MATSLSLATTLPSNASATRPRTAHPATCTTASALATWSLPALIRQTITVPVNGADIGDASAIARAGFGGILVFGIDGPPDFAAVVAQLKADVPGGAGLLVMTDDEGGGVWRLANLITPLPWARSMAAMKPAAITALATSAARQMVAIGITMDLAPVLDIDGRDVDPGRLDADGYRSFSGTESVVATDGVAFMKGLTAGGIVAVVKHFPGLGGVSPNTDDGPAKTAPWSTVEQSALKPFEAAINAGAPALMLSNATIPGLTNLPATVSPSVYRVLRQQLAFKGLLMTDSLSAGAVSAAHLSVETAAADAEIAGADDILFGLPSSGSALVIANEITEAIFAQVSQHHLSRATIVAAVTQVLAAKKINACAIGAAISPGA